MPLRLCRSRSARLATALAIAALLVVPRARAADAPPAPAAPAISAASTNTAPATNAVIPDLKPVPGATPLPIPARDERGEGRSEISPTPISRSDPQNPLPGGAPSIARPEAIGAPSGRAMLGAPVNGGGNPQPPTNAPAATLPTNTPPTGVGQVVTNPLPPSVALPPATEATTPSSAPPAPVPTPTPAPTRSSTLPSRDSKSPPSSSTATPRIDFSTFKILTERNIFDPNRSSRGSRYSPPPSDTPPPSRRATPSSVEAFSLVGTLAYGENQMAFIDGGSSQFKKALRLNDTVAGLKLKSVAANQATFDNDGADLAVRVGHGLRREDRGPWQVNTQPTAYAAAPSTSSTPSGTNTPPTAAAATTTDPTASSPPPTPGTPSVATKAEPAPTAAEAEALRRLLEKRRKEEEK